MRKRTVIRLDDIAHDRVSWVAEDSADAAPAVVKSGRLEEAADGTAGARVVVLVPGADVFITRVNVPSRNQRRITAAVPYLLEDQLAADVDDLHFAIGSRGEDNQVAVAVVAKARMAQWMSALGEAGIQPDAVLIDVLALPFEPDAWTLLLEDVQSLLRTGEQAGISMDTDNLPVLFPSVWEASGEQRPARFKVIDCRTDAGGDAMAFPEDVDVEAQAPNDPAVQVLASALDPKRGINLLQGAYSRREQLGKYWRPWRPAAAMLGAWFLLQIGIAVFMYHQLSGESAALKSQIENVYLETFPDAKNVPDPRLQMERKLAELRGGGNGGSDFLYLLAAVGERVATIQNVNMERISYRDGQMSVALTLSDLQTLDKLKQELSADGGLAVDIQSASSREDRVEAQLQIGRKGA